MVYYEIANRCRISGHTGASGKNSNFNVNSLFCQWVEFIGEAARHGIPGEERMQGCALLRSSQDAAGLLYTSVKHSSISTLIR
jgi:hypothetical protein